MSRNTAPFERVQRTAAVALEWTESVTRVSDTHVRDEVYARVREQFEESEIFALTFAVIAISSWNRLAIAFRLPAGTYQPQAATV